MSWRSSAARTRTPCRTGPTARSSTRSRNPRRNGLLQNLSKTTVTIRHSKDERAVPYRQIGSFKPGTGVGGAGVHWSGVQSRVMPEELRLKSHVTERYGAGFIPEDMKLQDWGVTYEELEPHFDRFEYVCGTSGKAGNIQGTHDRGRQSVRGAALARISAAAADRPSDRRAVRQGGAGAGLQPLSAAGRQRLAAL